MDLRNKKMKVTPEQSEVVQRYAFLHGFKWADGSDQVGHKDKPYLFFYDDMTATHSVDQWAFDDHLHEELMYDEFLVGKLIEEVAGVELLAEMIMKCETMTGDWLNALANAKDRVAMEKEQVRKTAMVKEMTDAFNGAMKGISDAELYGNADEWQDKGFLSVVEWLESKYDLVEK